MTDLLQMSQARHHRPSAAMIGDHPRMERLRSDLERAAALDLSVLLQGPTGSGKELAAELVHDLSARKGPLVPVNVASLPELLAEGELFGVRRGAYTGAVSDRAGLIERAAGGTLYLDETGDLSRSLQAKLLRVLDHGMVRRLGAGFDTPVDFRLVLSVQHPAHELVDNGRWRSDFFYRVASIVVDVPALRERATDIPLLVNHFLGLMGRGPLARGRLEPLLSLEWEGNVRQLRRVVERAVFVAGAEPVTPDQILTAARSFRQGCTIAPPGTPQNRTLRDAERDHIAVVLRETGFDTTAAAAILGLSRSQLYRRMEAAGIQPPTRRPVPESR